MSDDLIRREDAIKAMHSASEWWSLSKESSELEAVIWSDYLLSETKAIHAIEDVPSAQPKQDEESILKFYYVESIDDYWIGQRLDNFYYADWHEGIGFVWSKSRYLPWGEHVVAPDTLWKECTYPSEPKEIPFTEWIVGFMKKYAQPKMGVWILAHKGTIAEGYCCSNCGEHGYITDFCPNCGARMTNSEKPNNCERSE